MGAKLGSHLGAVNSVEMLRLRCYCPDGDACWHLRSARGRPMPRDRSHTLNVYGHGKITIGRAVWFLLKGEFPKSDRVVYRTCDSYDCANPAHFKCGRREAYLRLAAKRDWSPAKLAPLTESRLRRTKATPEIRKWIAESLQPASEIAKALGMSKGRIEAIRREMLKRPAASVFQLATFTAAHDRRKAA